MPVHKIIIAVIAKILCIKVFYLYLSQGICSVNCPGRFAVLSMEQYSLKFLSKGESYIPRA